MEHFEWKWVNIAYSNNVIDARFFTHRLLSIKCRICVLNVIICAMAKKFKVQSNALDCYFHANAGVCCTILVVMWGCMGGWTYWDCRCFISTLEIKYTQLGSCSVL